ncbi:MAG: hypothetical protein WKF34_07260 [Pyrinomonadaceae bacterium]
MKKTLLLLAAIITLNAGGFAQSDIKMQSKYGSENIDLLSVLRFEDIGLGKLIFSGEDLKGKDFQISVKQYVKGKLTKNEVVFDSKEDEYFRIKSDKFAFRVLTKITAQNTAKFDFQFNGFAKGREYKIGKNNQGFAQKDFLGGKTEVSIPLNTSIYILTFMMPYEKKDGSKQYCEVAQSGVNPEEFGTKYAIPTYFLIDIKFQ